MGLTERALRELLRILESGRVPSDESAASDLFYAVREALENRKILADLTVERDQLRSKLGASNFETDRARECVDALSQERDQLRSDIAGMTQVTAELRSEVERLREEVDHKRSLAKANADGSDKAMRMYREATARAEAAEANAANLKGAWEEAAKRADAATELAERLTRERLDMVMANTKLMSDLQSAEREFKRVEKALYLRTTENDCLQEATDRWLSRAEAAERERDEARTQVEELQGANTDAMEALRLANVVISQSQAQVEQLRRALKRIVPEITLEVERMPASRMVCVHINNAGLIGTFTIGDIRTSHVALSTTPAKALAKVRAEALVDVMRKVSAKAVQVEERESRTFSWSDAVTLISDEAERIESEGA